MKSSPTSATKLLTWTSHFLWWLAKFQSFVHLASHNYDFNQPI